MMNTKKYKDVKKALVVVIHKISSLMWTLCRLTFTTGLPGKNQMIFIGMEGQVMPIGHKKWSCWSI